MNDNDFRLKRERDLKQLSVDRSVKVATEEFRLAVRKHHYCYMFDWAGLPIIQYPTDICIFQELVWEVRPDLIIETGVARGGSILFLSSMLHLLSITDTDENPKRLVIGVDIDIRPENRRLIEEHPLSSNVKLIQGSSTSDDVVDAVRDISRNYNKILVILDSDHSHSHVALELQKYAPLVTTGSYIVVCDTVIEDVPPLSPNEERWGVGDSPKTAVLEFLEGSRDFRVEDKWSDKALLTVAPGGFLKKYGE